MLEAIHSIVLEPRITLHDVHRSRRQFGTQVWNELLRKQLSVRFGVVSFGRSLTDFAIQPTPSCAKTRPF